jgi:hypothetical protein
MIKNFVVIDKCAVPYEMNGKKGISYKVLLRVEQDDKVAWSIHKCTKDIYDGVSTGDSGVAYFDQYTRFCGFLNE